MRFLFWLIILFATAVGLAVSAQYDPGNVVFFYPPYRIDLSLNLFIVLTLLLFAAFCLLIAAIRTAQQMPGRVAAYRREKRDREGNRALRETLKAYFEGRFGHAEKAAKRASDSPENAGLAALIGARAAHSMQQAERRNAWLSSAREEAALRTARLMTEIELLVDEHNPEAALAAVNELNVTGTRHIHALRLALKANQRAQKWPEVLRLVHSLDKRNALHPALSRRLKELAYADMLGDKSQDAESIRRVCAAIPDEDRVKPFVAVRIADAMNARGLHDEARSAIEQALAEEWDDRLIRAYRASAGAEGSPSLLTQIERCEAWMSKHPSDPELALTLGALCLRQKLWGKAQRYLEQALSDATAPEMVRETHLKLAQMHEALGNSVESASHFRLCALSTML